MQLFYEYLYQNKDEEGGRNFKDIEDGLKGAI